MSDVGKREWCIYLDDMYAFAEKVLACTACKPNKGEGLLVEGVGA